jgi:hypothetical protein
VPTETPPSRGSEAPATDKSIPVAKSRNQVLQGLGHATLSLSLKEPGAKVYVFPHTEEPDAYPAERALLQCTHNCSRDLPIGSYTLRVESAEGVISHGELLLEKSRWLTVAPANQVARDFGFVTGAVGVVTTVLGVMLLADVICKSCSDSARNIGGATSIGLGVPMSALGWSLYWVHRGAHIEDQMPLPATPGEPQMLSAARVLSGYVAGARIAF